MRYFQSRFHKCYPLTAVACFLVMQMEAYGVTEQPLTPISKVICTDVLTKILSSETDFDQKEAFLKKWFIEWDVLHNPLFAYAISQGFYWARDSLASVIRKMPADMNQLREYYLKNLNSDVSGLIDLRLTSLSDLLSSSQAPHSIQLDWTNERLSVARFRPMKIREFILWKERFQSLMSSPSELTFFKEALHRAMPEFGIALMFYGHSKFTYAPQSWPEVFLVYGLGSLFGIGEYGMMKILKYHRLYLKYINRAKALAVGIGDDKIGSFIKARQRISAQEVEARLSEIGDFEPLGRFKGDLLELERAFDDVIYRATALTSVIHDFDISWHTYLNYSEEGATLGRLTAALKQNKLPRDQREMIKQIHSLRDPLKEAITNQKRFIEKSQMIEARLKKILAGSSNFIEASEMDPKIRQQIANRQKYFLDLQTSLSTSRIAILESIEVKKKIGLWIDSVQLSLINFNNGVGIQLGGFQNQSTPLPTTLLLPSQTEP